MKRKFWIGASFSALVIAAMAPWSASQASGVSVRVSTPEFGIRIGAPHFPVYQPVPIYQPVPVYRPIPVHYPRHYGYAPPPVVYVAPPRYRGHGHYRHRWEHRHWQHRHHQGHWHNGGHNDHRHGGR